MKKQCSFLMYSKILTVILSIVICFFGISFILLVLLCLQRKPDFLLWFHITEYALAAVLFGLSLIIHRRQRKQFLKLCADESVQTVLVIGGKALRKKSVWSADQQMYCSFAFENADTAAEFLQKRRNDSVSVKPLKRSYYFSPKDLALFRNKTILIQREFAEYFRLLEDDTSLTENNNKFVFEQEPEKA